MKAFLFLVLVGAVYGKPYLKVENTTCRGYDACPINEEGKINVHLVPHSHDDVGWLSTVDSYYYGSVQSIISSVIPALVQDPSRRFVQVETAFFHMWWRDQTDELKQVVVDLINEGRLEIINGAWSMNDEGAVHYQSTIDQFTLGLNYIQDNLGVCARPKVGWQIDPFGHSREQASIFSQLGYDSLYFARLDYRDRSKRRTDKTMDLIWTGSANLGSDSNIFTSAFYSHYSNPDGFCFDINCGYNPVVMDEDSPEYNWETKVNDLVEIIKEQIKVRPSNNLMFTLGDDFHWQAAMRNYVNLDKIIKGFEKFKPTIDGVEINIAYSTPSCYAKAVNDYVNKNEATLDVKTDDFFPYADGPNTVWSGYFTSRSTSKRFERQSNNLLQVTKQLKTIADLPSDANQKLNEAMGIMQHHDAITGTEKAAVEKDYHRMLNKAANIAVEQNSDAISKILGLDTNLDLHACLLSNVSICEQSSKDEFSVLLYNPLARSISYYMQIPVQSGTWTVTGPDGNEVENHLTDPVDSFSYITDDTGSQILEKIIIFTALDLPAVGYSVYKLKRTSTIARAAPKTVKEIDQIGFEDTYVNFDASSGLLNSITIKGVTVAVKNELMYYKAADEEEGAYIFRPNTDEREATSFGKVTNTVLVNDGNLVREVKQVWNDWAQQTIRIYKYADFIEFDWLVGPIDVSDEVGKDVVSRFTTTLKTKNEFYTDSNGREMIYRKKDSRPTYTYTNEEPQAGNYYPVNARISINDTTTRFAVLTDRSQGGASLEEGQVELMLHRGLLHDDHRGVGENLYEKEYGDRGLVARGSHMVTLGNTVDGNGLMGQVAVERDLQQRILLAPTVLLTESTIPVLSQSFLKKELPANVHLLTLDKWTDTTYLIRLEHIMEKEEDANLSAEVTVDLTDLFTKFSITALKEYNLAANVPLDEVNRLKWSQIQAEEPADSILRKEVRLQREEADLNIKLAPMQIRTFIATVQRN